MYGDQVAFGIVPMTFKLPDEMDDWEGENHFNALSFYWAHRHEDVVKDLSPMESCHSLDP